MTWNPSWSQANANGWWAEYVVSGGRVTSVWLEVGAPRMVVPLQPEWGNTWSMMLNGLEAGTPMVLRARNSLDQQASTYPFAFLDPAPLSTDPCGAGECVPRCDPNAVCGDDGCGGSCGRCGDGQRCDEGACVQAPVQVCQGDTCTCLAPWNPVWQQVNASNWWVEYTISRGTVTSAWVEVVGGDRVTLTRDSGRWVGSPPYGIPTGAQVVLHAKDDSGRTAQTAPFPYLTGAPMTTDACWGSGPQPVCPDLSAGMVSIDFDDGLEPQYTLARPLLQSHRMKATLYLISQAVEEDWPGYMSVAEVQAMMKDGHLVGSHTVDHQNLAELAGPNVEFELGVSRSWLEAHLGVPVTHLASPYGGYNSGVVETARRYYQTHTTVELGLNFPGDDFYRLKRVTVTSDMTPAQIHELIQQAASSRGWLILVFHNLHGSLASGFQAAPSIATVPDAYSYPITDFAKVLDDVAASGLEVVDVAQGAARMHCP